MQTLLQCPPHLCFEFVNVLSHDRCRPIRILITYCLQEFAVLKNCVLQVSDDRKSEEPDAQSVRVIAVEITGQVLIVGASIDALVDPLVEFDEFVGVDADPETAYFIKERIDLNDIMVITATGGEPSGEGFKSFSDLR